MRSIAKLITLIALSWTLCASTWYVDGLVVGGASDGTSWEDAFPDLQQALAVADSLDEVWVASRGSSGYLPTASSDRTISFVIPSGVTLYGGFAGGEATIGDRDWNLNPTVLNGDVGANGNHSDNSYNVVKPGTGSTLDGFTVKNGNGSGPTIATRSGAGIYITYPDVSVRNCRISENQTASSGKGAGLYTEGDSTLVQDCLVSFNESTGSFSNGGGAYAAWGEAVHTVFRRVIFQGNSSTGDGGGIHFGTLAEDCSFINNQGSDGAGSYWMNNVVHCYYEGNVATAGGGGAAYGYQILDSEFTQNSAQIGGGTYGTSTIQRCLIHGNTAVAGGGVYLSIGNIYNSVLFDNTATDTGGGILGCSGCAHGDAMNLTIVNNFAAIGGGVAAGLRLGNSIVWGNHAPVDSSYHAVEYFGVGKITSSIIEGSGGSGPGWLLDAVDAGGNLDADPLFVNAGMDDFHIGSGSPGFDAGSDSLVLGDIDIEGNLRIQGERVDMGSYEITVVVTAPGVRRLQQLKGYPNPFNPSVTIEFELPSPAKAQVAIYDSAGRIVRLLWDAAVPALTRLQWDGRDDAGRRVGSGVYFVRLLTAGVEESTKLLLLE